jgi:hypothetical protein
MKADMLTNRIDRAEIHRAALSGYSGPYSLGVGMRPGTTDAVLLLMVPADSTTIFPSEIEVDGERVPLLVDRSFKVPSLLPKSIPGI